MPTPPTAQPDAEVTPAPNWREYPRIELPVILDVALRQIVAHGYAATSVRRIATEVGVTVPALYYHFANKQAILMALLDHAMDLVESHVQGALKDAGEDPVQRLAAMVEAIVLYMTHHSDLAFLDSERRSLTPENREKYLGRRDLVDRQLDEAIADGCASGVFRTPVPHEARRAILSMCQGVAGWYDSDGPHTPGDTARDYVRIALAAVEGQPRS